MKIQINVTSDMIARGFRGNCYWCPISLAINEVLVKPFHSEVIGISLNIISFGGLTVSHFELPEECSIFQMKFDTRQPMTPFIFELDLPKEILRG